MPDVYDLWSGLAALKTLPPFVIALPILIALVFASIADWLERRLSASQEAESQDWVDANVFLANQHQSWNAARTGRPLVPAGDRSRKRV
jgi:hypothetical protein